MKTLAFLGLALFAPSLVAADTDANPAGQWKWSGKVGKKDADFVLTIEYKSGKVTGSLAGNKLDLKIDDGTYKDGELTFTATGEVKGEKVAFKGSGKITGDTIKGSITTERKGKEQKADWEAKREKKN